jgi:cobalt-zinc-cadmium efflux system outer membrane protein
MRMEYGVKSCFHDSSCSASSVFAALKAFLRRSGIPFIAGAYLLLMTPAAAALTLAEAVQAAIALQPGAELSGARDGESRAIARQASGLFAADPAIGVQHINDGVGSGDGAREWETGLQAPVWLPGQRAVRHALARAAAGQAEALERTRTWEIAGQVRERMWSVLHARARAENSTRALTEARQLESAVDRRVHAGELARDALLLARREMLQRRAVALEAAAERERAENSWRLYTGLTDLPADHLETPGPQRTVGADHPGLARHLADTVRAAAERDRMRHERRANPVLSIGTRHERGPGSEPWNDALMLGVQVPVGLPAQSGPALAAAEYAAAAAGTARDIARRDLEEDLHAAMAVLDSSRRAADAAREASQLAAESLRLAEMAFRLGEIDLFQLLQVRAQASEADWNAARLEIEAGWNIARCNQALGIIP